MSPLGTLYARIVGGDPTVTRTRLLLDQTYIRDTDNANTDNSTEDAITVSPFQKSVSGSIEEIP
jgi:hypothetical protein